LGESRWQTHKNGSKSVDFGPFLILHGSVPKGEKLGASKRKIIAGNLGIAALYESGL
jgi:hypothetical protein